MASEILLALIRANIAAGAATLMILLLRPQGLFGRSAERA